MGAGKSTVGRLLARISGAGFIDLDHYVERQAGCSIREIFALRGESGFRELERSALSEIAGAYGAGKPHLVLALGGGTLTVPECARLVREQTRCVYLACPQPALLERLLRNRGKRPLLASKTEAELESFIGELIHTREPLYRSCAQHTENTSSGTAREIAERIRERFGLKSDYPLNE